MNPVRYIRFRSVALARVAFAMSAALATVAAAPFTKRPYLQAPGPHSVVVMWETQSGGPGVVRFGEGDRLDRDVGPVEPSPVHSGADTFFVYQVRLAGLKPGATYRYEAAVGSDHSAPAHFKTFDPAAPTVTFIAYGDSRTNPDVHRALAAQFRRFNPDLILNTGDLVARGKDYALWSREVFEPLAGVIGEVPLLPAIGNHEGHGENYLAYFHPPGSNQSFYSCDVGPVHVLSLDYRSEKASEEQYAFVAADLRASRARWKVVLVHYPMFNLAGHGSLWGHESYLPLFRETKVDLVIGGHSHVYERFRPLAPKAQPEAWRIQYVTTGGGGAPLMDIVHDDSLACARRAYHFVAFTVTRDAMVGHCIAEDGTEIDAFTIGKQPDGGQAPEYVAQTYPEDDVVATATALNAQRAAAKAKAEVAKPAAGADKK